MNYLKMLISLLMIFSFSFTAIAKQSDWQLRKNKNGIKIYTRNVKNSNLLESRGELVINTSLSSLLAMLMDSESYTSWYPNLKQNKALKRISMLEGYIYQRFDMPWPLKDRDCILHTKVTLNPKGNHIAISFNNFPDYLPKEKHYVRAKIAKGHWKIYPQKNNKLLMEYQMFTDPGGKLPKWIINITSVQRPYKLLSIIRDNVKQSKYKHAKLEFIENSFPTN